MALGVAGAALVSLVVGLACRASAAFFVLAGVSLGAVGLDGKRRGSGERLVPLVLAVAFTCLGVWGQRLRSPG